MNTVATAVAEAVRTWSSFQDDIFDFGVNGTGNAVIEAVAGSGKTTTIVELIRRLPISATTLFLAFNKSIAEELKKRGVNARTFHSLTYGIVTRHKKVRTVEPYKLRNIVDSWPEEARKLYGSFAVKLVGLARNAGIGALVPDTEEAFSDLADHHEIELENDSADWAQAIGFARHLLGESNNHPDVDFDDLLYVAVKDGLALPKYDFVLVDEAQDTNAIQRAILRKLLHSGSRLIAVGDPAQAIYGFRGADSDALDLIAAEFNAKRLPLSVSYRCPQSVVAHARQWVQHIQPAPTAPEGKVTVLGGKWSAADFAAGDLVVCRTTAPIITTAYQLLKARVPAYVLGRDIGEGLKSLIKKLNAKGIPALRTKLIAWAAREIEKAVAKKDDAKIAAINDKTDCIEFLIDSLVETDRTIPALLRVIDELFADKANAVKLSTIHKAKGLEADKVFWLNSSQCPAKWARQDWQKQQERNLCYVATTRAKAELVLIESKREEKAA